MLKSNMQDIRTHFCESVAGKPFFKSGLNSSMTVAFLRPKDHLFLFCPGHHNTESYLEWLNYPRNSLVQL